MKFLKATTSVCPRCLSKVPAEVFEEDGRVFLRKRCVEHGEESALLASDARFYWEPRAGDGCGTGGCCMTNHSCTLIFEITERCNLTCPACFAGSSPRETWRMGFEEFERKLDRLLAAGKGNADLVQISGGEPTTHPDLERMIETCFRRGVRRVYLTTNGLRLGQDRAFARRLGALNAADSLQVYLQFDGFREETNERIRGDGGLLPVKLDAITNAIENDLYVLPVMTVTRGINLDEIGAVVRMVTRHHPRMNSVILQPAFYAGRYENPREAERVTVGELAREVSLQTDGLFSEDDFGPIPCSHPNCFALAVAVVRAGRIVPVSRYFPRHETWADPDVAVRVARFRDRMPQNLLQGLAQDAVMDELLDLLAEGDEEVDWSDHRNFLLIGIKPFMDAHTYDQDRVDRCCVHVVDRAGEPISLCEYNAIRRPRRMP